MLEFSRNRIKISEMVLNIKKKGSSSISQKQELIEQNDGKLVFYLIG